MLGHLMLSPNQQHTVHHADGYLLLPAIEVEHQSVSAILKVSPQATT